MQVSEALPHCLFTVDAEYHPQMPARVLEQVTRFNVLPHWFSARQAGPQTIRIVMELECFGSEALERMAKRIAVFPVVLNVSQTLMARYRG